VVSTVKVEVPLPPNARDTLVGFKLQVGRFCAPAGDVVRAQVRFNVPEYSLLAEKEIVEAALAPDEIAGAA
jgi:hypothetical protein